MGPTEGRGRSHLAPSAAAPLHVPTVRVGLVGLGTIGAVHRAVLTSRPDVRLVFIADEKPAPSSLEAAVLRFPSLGTALDAQVDVDLVVVATPTDTHLDLVAEVVERSSAAVLSEKPLTRDIAALERFRSEHVTALSRVRTVNHFAFSPEVVWAADFVARRQWGPPGRILSCFNDPYVAKLPSERRTYVSSWVDSGANQLALLARFSGAWTITGHEVDSAGLRSVTDVEYDGGSATLVSNWWTGASSKQSALRWGDDRELVLDHTSMTGVALEGGRVREHLGSDGTVDRKTAHYTAMYRAVLGDSDQHLLSFDFASGIAELLSQAVDLRAGRPGVRWSVTAATP